MDRKIRNFSLLILLLLICQTAFAAQRTDRLDLTNGSTGVGKLRFYEDTDDGSNYTEIKPTDMASDIVYTLPDDDGEAGEQLQSDGSGVLTWETSSGTATDVVCTDCVTLSTETSGAYVTDITPGTGIDLTETAAAAENNTVTVDVDSTEIGTTTWGSGSDFTWTFDNATANNFTMSFSDSVMTTNFPIQSGGSGSSLIFEGATDDAFETTLTVVDPTTPDKVITLPNETGTVCTTGSVCSGYDAVVTAGRSLTRTSNDILADVELYTHTICYRTVDPTASTDDKSVWINNTANGFTVTKLWAESDQTVTHMLQVDDGSAADMDTVDLAPAAGVATDTSLNGDATIAAGDRVDLDVTSVSGTPTWLSVCFTGTWDD